MMRWLVFAVCALSCSRADRSEHASVAPPPVAPVASPADATPQPSSSLVGWWRSPELCLEIFANGDFELSSMPYGSAKQQALGAATLAPGGASVKLAVARIWTARFISNCRKHVYPAAWADSMSALGVQLAPGSTVELAIRRLTEDQIELCATTCATLHRETPVLGGGWRRAEAPPGELLALDISDHGYGSSLHIAAVKGAFTTVYGTTTVHHTGEDRFSVDFEADADHRKRPFTARRLTGERIELCEASACITLERYFDPDRTNL